MASTGIGFAFIVAVCLWSTQLEARFCYRCLAVACSGDNAVCEEIRTFVVSNLRDYYDIGSYLQPCPDERDELAWTTMQITDSACPGSESSATCSAGRIQVKTYRGDNTPPLISHATVLGCANERLLHSIRAAKMNSQCDLITRNSTISANMYHRMLLEHCSEVQTLCHDADHCVAPQQSVVKEFVNSDRSLARFDYGLVIGIIAFIVVIFAAVIGASVCSFPVNKPSNLPKSSEDADLIRIRPTTSSANRLEQDVGNCVEDGT